MHLNLVRSFGFVCLSLPNGTFRPFRRSARERRARACSGWGSRSPSVSVVVKGDEAHPPFLSRAPAVSVVVKRDNPHASPPRYLLSHLLGRVTPHVKEPAAARAVGVARVVAAADRVRAPVALGARRQHSFTRAGSSGDATSRAGRAREKKKRDSDRPRTRACSGGRGTSTRTRASRRTCGRCDVSYQEWVSYFTTTRNC